MTVISLSKFFTTHQMTTST